MLSFVVFLRFYFWIRWPSLIETMVLPDTIIFKASALSYLLKGRPEYKIFIGYKLNFIWD